MKRYILGILALTLLGLVGCQEKGAAEKAGERVDEVIDNIKDGDAPLKKKGTMEKLGESIDDAAKKAEEKK